MKRSPLQILVLALIALGVIALPGCGEDSEGSETLTTSSITKAEYTDRLEEICARGRLQGLRFQPPGDGQSERDALTEAIDSTLLPAIQTVTDEIYAVGAPSAAKKQTEAMLVAIQEAVDEAEEIESPTLAKVEELLGRSGSLARKAGLESCIYG